MKTILFFLGIVACYAVLSLAASPLDASLSSSQDIPLPGASGRPVVVETTTTPPIPIEKSSPASPTAHRPSAVPQSVVVRTPEAIPSIVSAVELPREHVGEHSAESGLSSFEQFAPYVRKPEPQGASASSREYLRDPWIIEDLVLL